MTPLCQRTIICARRGRCQFCRVLLSVGDVIGRGPDGWLCLECTEVRTEVDRITDWLAYYWVASRTPPALTAVDADALSVELKAHRTSGSAALLDRLPALVGQRLHALTVEALLQSLEPWVAE